MSSNCGCGSGAGIGATQRALEAWAQLGGAGRCNDPVFAMSESGWPGIKIGAVSHQLRGPRTPIFRRNAANDSIHCGDREGGRSANKITVDFAACGCGGLDVSEFIGCNDLAIYQPEICCEGYSGRFSNGGVKTKVWTGISFDSAEYTNNVSYSQEDDNDLTISYPGTYRDLFTIYPLALYEQTTLIQTGTEVTYAKYYCGGGCSSCGCGCACEDCGSSWAGITAAGLMIYKNDHNATVKSVSVTGWPVGAVKGLVVFWGGYFWAIAKQTGLPDQVFRAKCATPSVWSTYTPGSDLDLNGFICTKAALIGFGQCGVSATLYDLGKNEDIANDFCRQTQTCGITIGGFRAAVLCGNRVSTVGGCLDDQGNETVTALAGQDCNLWAGTDEGNVQVSTDDGATWETVTNLPPDVRINIVAIEWANVNIGYIVAQINDGSFRIYATINGGASWGDERIEVPTGATINGISVPCCKNSVMRVNRVLVFGSIAGRGAIWSAEPIKC